MLWKIWKNNIILHINILRTFVHQKPYNLKLCIPNRLWALLTGGTMAGPDHHRIRTDLASILLRQKYHRQSACITQLFYAHKQLTETNRFPNCWTFALLTIATITNHIGQLRFLSTCPLDIQELEDNEIRHIKAQNGDFILLRTV